MCNRACVCGGVAGERAGAATGERGQPGEGRPLAQAPSRRPPHPHPARAYSYLQRRRDRQGPHFTYELVVVDDGSSDGTVAVASQYARKHGPQVVRVVQLPRVSAGVVVARGGGREGGAAREALWLAGCPGIA